MNKREVNLVYGIEFIKTRRKAPIQFLCHKVLKLFKNFFRKRINQTYQILNPENRP